MMEKTKNKAPAFEDANKWWVAWNPEKGKWLATPPIEQIHHLELHGEFSRHDAALAFAVAEANQ